MTAVMALGGSTNAVIHLIAMARRSGVPLDLDRFDEISRRVPVLANIRPSGEYLMEDFYYAGGLRGLLSRLEDDAPPRPCHRWWPTPSARPCGPGSTKTRSSDRSTTPCSTRADSPCCAAIWPRTAAS